MTTNPALATLQFLAGAWDMELSEASFLPDPDASVHGPVTSEWIEQGAAGPADAHGWCGDLHGDLDHRPGRLEAGLLRLVYR